MSTRINTNIEAMSAQRNLGVTAGRFASSVEKLSSGLRINRAADDAAGLAISQKLSSQVTGLNQAQRNAQDAISMVQTAEGALNETHSMLQRIRELAVEAGNSTLGSSDAQSVSAEITALQAEITRIGNTTRFNGQNLLSGALSVSQTGGTVSSGYSVAAGTGTIVTSVSVGAAGGSKTYTLSNTGAALTLSDGSFSQQLTVGALGAQGSETLNFDGLGVSITVASASGDSGTNIAAGLATGPATPPVIGIGGASGSDLVNGDVIRQTSAAPVTEIGMSIWGAIDSSEPPTAVASPGVAQGTLTVSVTALGHMTGSVGGENFAGDLAAFNRGNHESITLTGSRGNTITVNYLQDPLAANLADEAIDFSSGGCHFNFVAGPGTAAVSGLTVDPSAAAGSYNFTSSGAGSLTLNGPGGPSTVNGITDMGANEVRTLTFGNISFTLTADGNGMSASSLVSNLLQPANDTIVVTSTGGSAGAAGTVTTGANANATFQIGANQGDTLGMAFTDARSNAYSGFDAAIANFAAAANSGTGITTAAGALISAADSAINSVSAIRASYGAVENRLNHTVASIGIASENLNASMSRIRDLDMAAEMVTFTKNQIMQQAGTSILAQANSAPQNILTLLR
ncbi:MAG TPA: flagellin [Candidatus Limnocylindrales bacterium]